MNAMSWKGSIIVGGRWGRVASMLTLAAALSGCLTTETGQKEDSTPAGTAAQEQKSPAGGGKGAAAGSAAKGKAAPLVEGRSRNAQQAPLQPGTAGPEPWRDSPNQSPTTPPKPAEGRENSLLPIREMGKRGAPPPQPPPGKSHSPLGKAAPRNAPPPVIANPQGESAGTRPAVPSPPPSSPSPPLAAASAAPTSPPTPGMDPGGEGEGEGPRAAAPTVVRTPAAPAAAAPQPELTLLQPVAPQAPVEPKVVEPKVVEPLVVEPKAPELPTLAKIPPPVAAQKAVEPVPARNPEEEPPPSSSAGMNIAPRLATQLAGIQPNLAGSSRSATPAEAVEVSVLIYPLAGEEKLPDPQRPLTALRDSLAQEAEVEIAPSPARTEEAKAFPAPYSDDGAKRLAAQGVDFVVTGSVTVGRNGFLTLELYHPPQPAMVWMATQPVARESDLEPAVRRLVPRLISAAQKATGSPAQFEAVFVAGASPSVPASPNPYRALFPATSPERSPALGNSGKKGASTPPAKAAAHPAAAPEETPETRAASPSTQATPADSLVESSVPLHPTPVGEPAASPVKTASKATAKTSPASASPSGYTLQAGAFNDEANARELEAKLKKRGYDPQVYRVRDNKGRSWVVVRFGSYPDADAARAGLSKFKAKESMEALLAPAP
ncbi:MAG: SPOR domain-containing protein [Magnetococcales bacterium]|nr:SPOR domain-containing protein [Magnetococcales bacterium]